MLFFYEFSLICDYSLKKTLDWLDIVIESFLVNAQVAKDQRHFLLKAYLMSWITKIFPFLLWIKELKNPEVLKADAIAGATVALVLVPQSMAYAQLAGLGPQYGLYASFLPVMIAALMGSSRQLSTGPVAIVSLLTAAALGDLATDPSSYAVYAALLALIVGLFQFMLGILRIGFVINFISHPVVNGFTNAAAIIVSVSQLHKIFGIRVISTSDTDWNVACQPLTLLERLEQTGSSAMHAICNADQNYETLWRLIDAALDYVHIPTLMMSALAFLTMLVLKHFYAKIPGTLAVVVVSILVSWVVGYESMGGAIVSSINMDSVFSFKVPSFDLKAMGSLFIFAVIISLIGFMEAISVAKSMAAKTKQRLDVNQELIGQGLANITSSFFQGYAVAGSFSRTSVNASAGAITGFSSVITALIVGIMLLWLTPLLYHLPQATLAAVIMMAVFHLINFSPIWHAWKIEKHDAIVGLLTFVLTLISAPHLENGIAFGVILSLGLFLYRTMQPNFSELSAREGSSILVSAVENNLEGCKVVSLVKYSGSLYFANAAYFETKMLELIAHNREHLRYIIVDVAGINQIDASGEEVLLNLVESCSESGVEILFARIEGLDAILEKAGFKDRVGQNRFFQRRVEALRYAWREIGDPEAEFDSPLRHLIGR